MTAPMIGYSVPDIETLKSITSDNRTPGYTVLVPRSSLPHSYSAWYTCTLFPLANGPASIVTLPNADDDNYVLPNDAALGEFWVKHGLSVRPWKIITDSTPQYTLKNGDKVMLLSSTSQPITVALPDGNQIPVLDGDHVTLLNVAYPPTGQPLAPGATGKTITVLHAGHSGNTPSATFSAINTKVTLVYYRDGGWYPTVPGILTDS